jgi:hypothetical protein
MNTIYTLMIALALPLAAATTSWAGDYGCGAEANCGCAVDSGCCSNGCCCDNGCCNGCCKVCKLVRVVREVKATGYGVKYTDIAIPGCGSACYNVDCLCCGGKGCNECCSSGGCCKIRYPAGQPGCCARVKTVKQLVKYERTKKICTYEWRVCDAGCCGCNSGCDAGCGCAAGHEIGCGVAEYQEGDAVPTPPTPTPEA